MVWKAQTTNSNYKVSVHLAEKINRGEDLERVSLVTTEIAAAGDVEDGELQVVLFLGKISSRWLEKSSSSSALRRRVFLGVPAVQHPSVSEGVVERARCGDALPAGPQWPGAEQSVGALGIEANLTKRWRLRLLFSRSHLVSM